MQPSGTASRLPMPTLRCGFIIILAIGSFVFGFLGEDRGAIQAGFFLLAMTLFGWIVAWFNFRSFEYRRDTPGQVFAVARFPVKVNLSSQRAYLGSWCIEIEDELLGNGRFFQTSEPRFHSEQAERLTISELPPGEDVEHEFLAAITNRGIYEKFRYHISSSFPFGLFRCSRGGKLTTEITVYPKPAYLNTHENISFVEAMGEREVFSPTSDVSGELRGLREFVHGDSLRLIHWRASAKYEGFVVREFEPTTPEQVCILYHSVRQDLGHSRAAREHCLQLLAGLLIELNESGARTELFAGFNNWRPVVVDGLPGSLDDALEMLARARIRSEKDLGKFLSVLRHLPEQNHRFIVVSDTPLRYWADELSEFPDVLLIDNEQAIPASRYEGGTS